MRISDDDLAMIVTKPLKTYPKGRFLSVAPRVTQFSGQINGVPLQDDQTLGEFAFNYDNAVGSYTPGFTGMSVDFGTAPGGRDIGTTRVRKAPTATQFYIPETAPSLLKLADNQYFTVKKEYRPYLLLPRGTEAAVGTPYINTISMFVDYDLGYSGGNEFMKPKANITRSATLRFGVKPAAFVDAGQTHRTVVLSGVFSFAVADGATIVAYTWDVGDGTITSGTSASITITATFPVGFRWVQLQVEDSNGQLGVMAWPIWVHDADHMPLSRFHITRDTTTDWREMDLAFFQQETDETVIPKGTALCVWENDPFWGEAVPDQYRDHFLGYCNQDAVLFRKTQSIDTLTITGLGEWLNRFRSIPQRISDPGRVPNSWFEMQNIYLDKLVSYMAVNFSNAAMLGNIFYSGVTDPLKSLDITQGGGGGQFSQAQGILGQIQYIVQGYFGQARYDSLNALWIRKHYSFLTADQQAVVDKVIDLVTSHWRDSDGLKLVRRNYHVISSVLGAGANFNGTTSTIFNARAPGRTPADGDAEQDAPGQNLPLTDSQNVLTQLTGAYYKFLDNENPEVPLPLLPNLDVIEPAWGEPVTVTDPDQTAGFTLDHAEFLVKTVEISYDDPYKGASKRITLTLSEVTTASVDDAQESDVPVDVTDPVDAEPPVDIVVPPTTATTSPFLPETGLQPTQGIVFSSTTPQASRAVSYDPTTGLINYEDISTGLSGAGVGYCIWAYADPWFYKRMFLLTDIGLMVCNDISVTTPVWSLVANNAALFGNSSRIGHYCFGSPFVKNFGSILIGENVQIYTDDNWATWHEVHIDGLSARWSSPYTCSADLIREGGHLMAILNDSVTRYHWNLYKCTDGHTWSVYAPQPYIGTQDNGDWLRISIPYTRPGGAANMDDSDFVYWLNATHHNGNGIIYNFVNGVLQKSMGNSAGCCSGDFAYPDSRYDDGNLDAISAPAMRAISAFTHDSANAMYVVVIGHVTDNAGVRYTPDDFITRTVLPNSVTGFGGTSRTGQFNLNGWPGKRGVWMLYNGGLFNGTSWVGGFLYLCINGVDFFGSMPVGWDGVAYGEFSLFPFQS